VHGSDCSRVLIHLWSAGLLESSTRLKPHEAQSYRKKALWVSWVSIVVTILLAIAAFSEYTLPQTPKPCRPPPTPAALPIHRLCSSCFTYLLTHLLTVQSVHYLKGTRYATGVSVMSHRKPFQKLPCDDRLVTSQVEMST